MQSHGLAPERITKPIQLLAAWLIGLFVTNASFLLAAQQITRPEWGSAMLLIASVANVPLFIGALFLLQTKFRAQMQEDSYYSKFLEEERKFTASPKALSELNLETEFIETAEKIIASIGASAQGKEKDVANILQQSQTDLFIYKHGATRALTELYKAPHTWDAVVSRFESHEVFRREVDGLIGDGLALQHGEGLQHVILSELGRNVAQQAEAKGVLYAQLEKEKWTSQHAFLKEKSVASTLVEG